MNKNKEYAFWKYDLFPYMLGGTVTGFSKGGLVETEEFGRGHYFKPIVFTSKQKGKEMRNKLETLAEQRNKALEVLSLGYQNELEDLWTDFNNGEI